MSFFEKNKKKLKKSHKAFTIIEMLVVISIIGVLASIVIIQLSGAEEKAKMSKIRSFSVKVGIELAGDVVSEWRLDESMGDTAYDAWGINNGTLYSGAGACSDPPTLGCPHWEEVGDCVSGYCLEFDGTDDWVDCGDDASLTTNITNNLTVEAWANPYNVVGSSNCQNIASQYGDGSNGWILRTSNSNDGHFHPYIYVGGWHSCDGGFLEINKWSHLVLTYDGETVKGYLNGIFVCQNTDPSGNLAMTGSTVLAGSYTGERFEGIIDEVKIFSRAYSAMEIQKHYVAGLNSLLKNTGITMEEYNQRIAKLENSLSLK